MNKNETIYLVLTLKNLKHYEQKESFNNGSHIYGYIS